MENANLLSMFRSWSWEDLQSGDPSAVTVAKSWAETVISGEIIDRYGSPLSGKGLLLHGRPGRGKTAIASVVLQHILENSSLKTWGQSWDKPYQPSRPGYFIYYRRIPQLLQRRMGNHVTEEESDLLDDLTGLRTDHSAIKILVLDDVGKEHRTSSGWATGLFEEMIRERFYSGWPTVVTTNISPDKWADVYGESCASFAHEAFAHVEVLGSDFRQGSK